MNNFKNNNRRVDLNQIMIGVLEEMVMDTKVTVILITVQLLKKKSRKK